jgi:hypothetical protein
MYPIPGRKSTKCQVDEWRAKPVTTWVLRKVVRSTSECPHLFLDALEVFRVARDQGCTIGDGMGRDGNVEVLDEAALLLERCLDLT